MSKPDIQIHLDLTSSVDNNHPSNNTSIDTSTGNGNGNVDNGGNNNNNNGANHLKVNNDKGNRRRSNSQSQVVSTPNIALSSRQDPSLSSSQPKRKQFHYFVTLTSLNETFVQKHFSVPYFPDTRKLGRPTGAKIKPDVTNGFFDSRVLSRNHAAMYIDNNSGKLMLKDLGSSNGTYVNDVKLETESVEIKVGDAISFGFNIQAGMNHKQINAKVESIDIMNNLLKTEEEILNSNGKPLDSVEFKHYKFIQDLYNKISNDDKTNNKQNPIDKPETSVTFESAMFSDINPEIEDSLLGLYSKASNGIFKNSGTSTSSKLEQSINLLVNCFSKLKQQHNSLISLEEFLELYKTKTHELNNSFLQHQYDSKLNELNHQINNEKSINETLLNDFKHYKDEHHKKNKKLEEKFYKLREEKLDLTKKLDELNLLLQAKDEKIKEFETSLNNANNVNNVNNVNNDNANNDDKSYNKDNDTISDTEEIISNNKQEKNLPVSDSSKLSLDDLVNGFIATQNGTNYIKSPEELDSSEIRTNSNTKDITLNGIKNMNDSPSDGSKNEDPKLKDKSLLGSQEPKEPSTVPTENIKGTQDITNESSKSKDESKVTTESSEFAKSINLQDLNFSDSRSTSPESGEAMSQIQIDQLDEDNDLRYDNSGVILGIAAIIIGMIIHKYIA